MSSQNQNNQLKIKVKKKKIVEGGEHLPPMPLLAMKLIWNSA